uniref:non-specific serine/threonine protein kinase n=1 Tax=Scophthalmus maximus TaxID=52904 RepID=A0A8D3AE07_SCOMX
MATGNYVVQLNEYAQKNGLERRFEDVGSDGPDHIRTFTVRAIVNGKEYPAGVGKNKKEAKQNAAKNALRCLSEEEEHADRTENALEASNAASHQTSIRNYVCWLNEHGNKNRLLIKPVESTRLGLNNVSQCCRFEVGGTMYPVGYGKTKKEAKEEAAKLAYREICGSKTTETTDEKYGRTSSPQKDESGPNVSEVCDMTTSPSGTTVSKTESENFIGIINQFCQEKKVSHDYILEKRHGQPHSPHFFYRLVINKKEYPVGEGKNVKEAKQKAAQLAWSALKEQSDWDSKVTESNDGAASRLLRLLTLPSTPESRDAQSKSMPTFSSDSAVFTNSSKDQDQSPDVKPKIRLAANFKNACRQSKEEVVNFKSKNKGSSLSEKTTTQSVLSRFTSDFDLIVPLGKGAFGHVFKAKEKLLDKYCAVKIVRCKEIHKALREVKALSDLQHCNIVRYYTCWMEDSGYQRDSTADGSSASQSTRGSSVNYLYIQMELCDTRTLRVWIDEKNTADVKTSLRDSKRREESLTIAEQIVSGVDYIHSKRLIHRDLKPANIMFGDEGKVKIGDFGLVTAENDDDAENLIERTVYKGTPCYMAPEQKSGIVYDRKVDIFALGLICFELLWNLSEERKEIWDDARKKQLPQRFSHIFHQENQIIKSMLCLKPEDRPEASKLKKDFEEFTQTLTTPKNMHCGSMTV